MNVQDEWCVGGVEAVASDATLRPRSPSALLATLFTMTHLHTSQPNQA